MKRLFFVLAILIPFWIVGCSQSDLGVEVSDQLTFEYPFGDTTENLESMQIWIKNNSKECIVYPPDFGVMIYMENHGVEKLIRNNLRYIGSEERTLEPSSSIFSEDAVIFSPDVPLDLVDENTKYFITIEGHLCDDENVIVKNRFYFLVNTDQ